MAKALPLAAASARLRGKPGRPRAPRPETGPSSALTLASIVQVPPRLLDLEAAALYLGGVSPWTVRDLIDQGTLPRVRVPLPRGRELRRVLVAREDLDALVDRSKESG